MIASAALIVLGGASSLMWLAKRKKPPKNKTTAPKTAESATERLRRRQAFRAGRCPAAGIPEAAASVDSSLPSIMRILM